MAETFTIARSYVDRKGLLDLLQSLFGADSSVRVRYGENYCCCLKTYFTKETTDSFVISAPRRLTEVSAKLQLEECPLMCRLKLNRSGRKISALAHVTMESYEHEAGFECSQLVIDVHYKTWRVTGKVCR